MDNKNNLNDAFIDTNQKMNELNEETLDQVVGGSKEHMRGLAFLIENSIPRFISTGRNFKQFKDNVMLSVNKDWRNHLLTDKERDSLEKYVNTFAKVFDENK